MGNHFEKAVNNVFESELRPLGFTLRQEFSECFSAENEHIHISMFFWKSDYVGVELNTPTKARVGDMGIELYGALEFLAPEVPEKLRYPILTTFYSTIERELLRQIKLMTGKLGMLIEGEPETWHKLRRWIDTGRGRRQRFNESDDQYLDRVRESLKSALKNKEYWKASEYFSLLSEAQGGLSLRDHFRRWLASQHTYMLP